MVEGPIRPGENGIFWILRALHPLGPVGAQAVAQGCTLATQLALLALLGRGEFASLGLGLMAATGVCFLGEAGYFPYFLRESAKSDDWMAAWREAAGVRLVVVCSAAVLAWIALGWAAPDASASRRVLAAALPGLGVSVFNPAPLLFGRGNVRSASGGVVVRFVVQGALAVGLAWAVPGGAAWGIGGAVSVGIFVQASTGPLMGLPWRMFLPVFRLRPPPPVVLRLWGVSLVGILNDRALPFVVGAVRPEILAVALIVIQVLQSLAGLGAQMNRLLIPAAARGGHPGEIWRGLRVPLAAASGAMVLVLPGLSWAVQADQAWAALFLALEWAAVLVGGIAFSLVFARGNERPLIALMLAVVPVSILAQILLSEGVGLEAALAIRVIVAAVVARASVRCLR